MDAELMRPPGHGLQRDDAVPREPPLDPVVRQGGPPAFDDGHQRAVLRRASDRRVVVGPISGGRIAVLSGLEPGETIIAAGVNAVEEGMLIRRLQRERGL